MPATAGGQYDACAWETNILRLNDLVVFAIFQEAVLVDARAVSESIASYYRLIRLHRHTHLRTYHAAYFVNIFCVDIGKEVYLLMGFQDHYHLFYRGIAGTFANAVDSAFYLPGACH